MIYARLHSSLEPLESRIAPAALLAIAPQDEDPGDGNNGPILRVGSITDNISGSVAHGGQIIYTIVYQNVGDTTASNVTLTETPDPHTSFDSNGSDSGFTVVNGAYQYNVGTLPADGPHTVHFAVQVAGSIPTSVRVLTDSASLENTGNSSVLSLHTTLLYQGIIVSSPGISAPGKFARPEIMVRDITTGDSLAPIFPYPATVRDSLRVATGDFNADGFDDVIVSTEHGRGPVEIFDGKTGNQLEISSSLAQPFGPKSGAFVASGNLGPSGFFFPGFAVNGLPPADGHDDLAFGSSLGGGAVRVVDGRTGENLEPVFYPFGKSYHGGVRVAIGDVDGNGTQDLIVAQGNFGHQVKVYSGGDSTQLIASFTVGGSGYAGGLNIAAGDVNGDGRAEIVTGRNRLSDPMVEVFHVNTVQDFKIGLAVHPLAVPLDSVTRVGGFEAAPSFFQGGVRVALADVNGDGFVDFVTGTGYGGGGKVTIFDGGAYAQQKFATVTPALVISTGHGTTSAPTVLESFSPGFSPSGSASVTSLWVAGSTPVPSVPSNFLIGV